MREYEELWTRSQGQDELLRSSTETLTALAAKFTDATNPPSPHKTTMRKMADREAEIQQLLRDKDQNCEEQVRSQESNAWLVIFINYLASLVMDILLFRCM